jgi:hypothetical protein
MFITKENPMKHLLLSLLLVSAAAWPAASSAAPAEVIMIRHGEKPASGNELNDQGWQRAYALVDFFTTNNAVLAFGTPAAIYAMGQKGSTGSIRPIQTVTPLAQKLNLPILHPYLRDDTGQLAQEILGTSAYDGKMVLVCWEHNAIPSILSALGWTSGPDAWPGDAYDRVWILDFKDGKPVSFRDLPQKLLPGDSQN